MTIKEIEAAARSAYDGTAVPEIAPGDILRVIGRVRQLEAVLDQIAGMARSKAVQS